MQNAETKWNKDIKCQHTYKTYKYIKYFPTLPDTGVGRHLKRCQQPVTWHTRQMHVQRAQRACFALPLRCLQQLSVRSRPWRRCGTEEGYADIRGLRRGSPAAFRPRPGAGSPWPWQRCSVTVSQRRFKHNRMRFCVSFYDDLCHFMRFFLNASWDAWCSRYNNPQVRCFTAHVPHVQGAAGADRSDEIWRKGY